MTTVIEVEDLVAEERKLAERAVAGDGDAFAELYGRYERRAYNLCLRIVGSEDDAADATQEAFVNVLKRLAPQNAAQRYAASQPGWLVVENLATGDARAAPP